MAVVSAALVFVTSELTSIFCPLDTKMDRKDKLFVVNEVSLLFNI